MKGNQVAIRLKNISKTFKIRERSNDSFRDLLFNVFKKNERSQFVALNNINVEVQKGEFLGIIGHNGSGKSTLLNIIMGSIIPNKGAYIETNGKIIRLALGMGFDAGLSARENIYVNGSILGLTFKEIGTIFHDIIDFANLNDFVDVPIKYYSSGMRSRLTFSIAIHAKAEILLMDEFFGGVGDLKFKKKSQDVFENRLLNGRTIIHVNHNMGIIEKHCDRVLLLDKGKQIYLGDPKMAIEKYKILQSG